MPFPTQLAQHLQNHSLKMVRYLSGDFSGLSEAERRVKAAEVRNLSAWSAAWVAPIPVPFSDFWAITPIQIAMVQAIGNIYGHKLDKRTARAAFGTVAGGALGRQAFMGLLKIGLPGAGGFIGAAFAYAWTYAMGHAAERYFASGMTATQEELAEARRQGVEEARQKGLDDSGRLALPPPEPFD